MVNQSISNSATSMPSASCTESSKGQRPVLKEMCRILLPLSMGMAVFGVIRPATAEPTHANKEVLSAAPDLPEDLIQAKLLNAVVFDYPQDLITMKPSPAGQVIINYVVGIDGIPTELKVTRGVHPRLDDAVMAAISALRYEPARYRGEAVEIVLSIGLDVQAPVVTAPVVTAPVAKPEPESPRTEEATGLVRLSGTLLEAGFRTPIDGATVLAIPAGDLKVGRIKKRIYESDVEPEWTLRATTNNAGHWNLRGLPNGKVRLVILAQGYRRLEYVVKLSPGEALELKYYQTRLNTNPYRTIVDVAREEMEEVTRRSISVEELSKIPGTQGDALKAIQNFPGVARAPFNSGALAIRGAAPGDSAIYLGYHEIPILYHFGGLTSVFNSDILSQIDFIPGNFDSRYGDAIGGIVNVVPRKGRRDGIHGYIDSDIFDTGILLEGKAGKGSFILSGRRSYIDLLLPALIPDDAGINFSIAPRYWDYQALFDYPVSGGEFSVRVFGSDDRTKLVFAAANDEIQDRRDSVESVNYFHRADLVYRKVKGPWEFLVTPSYKRDFFEIDAIDIFKFDSVLDTFSLRAEVSNRLSSRSRVRLGTEFINVRGDLSVTAPAAFGNGDGTLARTQLKFSYAIPALYSTLTLAVTDAFVLYPGVRLTYYSAPVEQFTTDPRLRLRWALGEKTTLKGGVGLYSQGPTGVQFDKVFGNPRVGPERALHTSVGLAQDLPWDMKIEATGFHKKLWDMISSSSTWIEHKDGRLGPEKVANTGTGYVVGGELLLRKPLSSNLFGWVSYTIMRSMRKHAPGESERLFDFDQTHLLTVIASYKLPRRWQIGARFRLASGNPYTGNTAAVWQASENSWLPIAGPINGERYSTFHQLDMRVDKMWVYRKTMFTLYLDIQNVYNAQNVEFLNYSYNYREYTTINSLPIIPSVGTKIEF